ncbi:Peroxisomal biogenesis factor 11 [Cladophialophora carrionii]|uniref:Peroxisomal biogenesis factor 11 n=1 Tax=Cladophialophora carrionii TaxID=86049 RepID=A0A1C1CSM4_9EURO|nr:Peroxisomal biogenesis factor 11 [Cladophialophora carrionii]
MLNSISKFSNDPVGVEKTLKLLQSTAQIAASVSYPSPDEAALWTVAKNNVALARRFFRLVKWIDCFNIGYAQYELYQHPRSEKAVTGNTARSAHNGLHFLLIVLKWSLLGAYLFVEMFTIVDAVAGTWRPWAVTTQTEALKLWFYSLAVSVMLDLYEILVVYSNDSTAPAPVPTPSPPATRSKGSSIKEDEKQAARSTKSQPNAPPTAGTDSLAFKAAKRRSMYRQLVIDGCDLLIPGAAVGWLALDPITVGVAGSVSALVGGSDAWARVNR